MPVTRTPTTDTADTDQAAVRPPPERPPLTPIRSRGFAVPWDLVPCYCEPYKRIRPHGGTGLAFSYCDHAADCRQHRFMGIAADLVRWWLLCGGELFRYATVQEDQYAAWCKRISNPRSPDYDARFQEDLWKWACIPDGKRVVLTPFPPRPRSVWDTESPLTRDQVIDLAVRAVSTWTWPNKDRLVSTQGGVSYRDFRDLAPSRSWESYGPYPGTITRRWTRMAELSARQLEESLGSLGVGIFTFRAWHSRTCPLCSPGYLCPLADMDTDYERVKLRFNEAVMTAWRETLADLLAMREVGQEVYESMTAQLKERTKELRDAEAGARRRELGLVALPALTETALPVDAHKTVLDLAQSADSLARAVATAINEDGASVLTDPFREYKAAKLAFAPDDQRRLGKIDVDKLLTYALARTRFQRAEAGFVARVQEVLGQYKARTPDGMKTWFRWDLSPGPPPALEVVERGPAVRVVEERRAA